MVSVGDSVTTEIWSTVDGQRVKVALQGVVVEVDERRPPLFGQRDPRWADRRYSKTASYTFRGAGCLVCCVASLAAWAGYDTDPVRTAAALDAVGGFATGRYAGNLIGSKVPEVFPRLRWVGASYVDWATRPASVELLQEHLARYPVIVQVDFDNTDADIDTHFMLAYRYEPDPSDGPHDAIWVMDPWDGAYLDAAADSVYRNGRRVGGGYFNPSWVLKGTTMRVERLLTGARIYTIDDGGF